MVVAPLTLMKITKTVKSFYLTEGRNADMKETKKEWKNPEIIVLSVNGDTENGMSGSSDGLDIGS